MRHLLCVLCGLLFSFVSLPDQDADKCMKKTALPTAFSPNDDGNNDLLTLYVECIPDKFEIVIYNNWGETMFQSTDYLFKWDGKDATGVKQPPGVYVYTFSITYAGTNYSRSGDVVLIR